MRTDVVLAVPDLVSPSYFPAIAAVDLGFVRDEGLDARLELLFPVTEAARALREGRIDLLACAAHDPLYAFPEWHGAKLVTALSRHSYWFLVMRADLGIAAGDLAALHDVRIAAAPGPELTLRIMLAEAGVDTEARAITITPVPRRPEAGTSFGLAAAAALADGAVDGFWANGMGAEVAVRAGTGTVVVDARRGDGPAALRGYTFPALAATESTVEHRRGVVAAVSRAVGRAQRALRADPDLATETGRRLFPPLEAATIAELVRRDAPFYLPDIDTGTVASLLEFCHRAGLLERATGYDVLAPGLDSPTTTRQSQ